MSPENPITIKRKGAEYFNPDYLNDEEIFTVLYGVPFDLDIHKYALYKRFEVNLEKEVSEDITQSLAENLIEDLTKKGIFGSFLTERFHPEKKSVLLLEIWFTNLR